MGNTAFNKVGKSDTEDVIRKYLLEARERLETDFGGSRVAIKEVSEEKIGQFIVYADIALEKKDRELLSALYSSGMYQAFCYGYGIAKAEGYSKRKIVL